MDAKTKEAIDLLRTLIATPSPSRDESRTADLIFAYLAEHGAAPERLHNNVFARSAGFDPARPTLLLNSHHDTVRPAASYTRDPYAPTVEGDRLYGLGSNDAGASAVSLTQTFLTQRTRPLPFNLLLALSAEEECMGEHGMRTLLPQLGRIDMAIVGEPTGMQAAVGERGLVVLDCEARGKSGHAARNEGVNALYIALDDIARLRDKVDAGAEYVITQMFFDNAKYFDFVRRCREAGITVPIIPGIKPLSTLRHLEILPETFGVKLPEELVREVKAHPDGVREVGTEWAIAQSRELMAAGVPVLHYYTMSRTTNIQKIVKAVF